MPSQLLLLIHRGGNEVYAEWPPRTLLNKAAQTGRETWWGEAADANGGGGQWDVLQDEVAVRVCGFVGRRSETW